MTILQEYNDRFKLRMYSLCSQPISLFPNNEIDYQAVDDIHENKFVEIVDTNTDTLYEIDVQDQNDEYAYDLIVGLIKDILAKEE